MNRRRRYPRPTPIGRRADSECPECGGYPYHKSWCVKVKDN